MASPLLNAQRGVKVGFQEQQSAPAMEAPDGKPRLTTAIEEGMQRRDRRESEMLYGGGDGEVAALSHDAFASRGIGNFDGRIPRT